MTSDVINSTIITDTDKKNKQINKNRKQTKRRAGTKTRRLATEIRGAPSSRTTGVTPSSRTTGVAPSSSGILSILII